MDKECKHNLIKEILDCTKSAFDMDSDDSDKYEFINGLLH